MDEALAAIARAAALAPDDATIALGLAQISFEAGRDARPLYARAHTLAPGREDIGRGHANALAAEGEGEAAQALLADMLRSNPGWLEGHRALASLRTTAGDPDFARGYREAVARQPQNRALWLGWFQTLSAARDWDGATGVLDAADRALGDQSALKLARLYLVSESGQASDDPGLFDAVEDVSDTGLDLARVRHFLRGGQVERARDVALRHRGTPVMRAFWSYLALAWRLLGDAQADWLDSRMDHVRSIDLDFTTEDLATLANRLRALHTMRAPWHEQSVRGGTQTERPLLLRLDPEIAAVRRKIEAAVRDYIAALPMADSTHPLLAAPRGAFRFSGSWSVRLRAQGFHAVHTHPMGWISSALYVTVPEAADLGAAPAGHLRFGAPPPELGLPLEPYGEVVPRPGRLALFPSTMWHGTEPFADGERMTIAFDVVPAG